MKLTRVQTIQRNQTIRDFIFSNYNASPYQAHSGRTYYYFTNPGNIKFAIFDTQLREIKINKIEEFLKSKNISFKRVKAFSSRRYNSLIVYFK